MEYDAIPIINQLVIASTKRFPVHYVYIFSKQGIPFYVGKGSKTRFLDHLERSDFPSLNHVSVSFIEFPSEESALMEEERLITAFGLRSTGGLLVNKVGGHSGFLYSRTPALPASARLYSSLKELAEIIGLSTVTIRARVQGDPAIRRIVVGRLTKYRTQDVIISLESDPPTDLELQPEVDAAG